MIGSSGIVETKGGTGMFDMYNRGVINKSLGGNLPSSTYSAGYVQTSTTNASNTYTASSLLNS